MTPEMFDSIIADLCGSPDLKFSQRYAIQRLRKERNDLQSQLAAANERADGLQRIVDEARAQKPVAIYEEHHMGRYAITWTDGELLFGTQLYAAPVPSQPAVVPDEVVMAFGLLWHVRMGCDFPVPEGFSRNISPEEAAAKARRFLAGLLTREQRGEGINRAAAILSTTDTEGRKDD